MDTGGSSDHSLLKRIIVAVVCAPVILWLFLLRGLPLFFFLIGLTAFGQWELYSMFGERLHLTHRVTGYLAGLAIVTDAFLARSAYFSGILITLLILSFVIEIAFGREDKLKHVMLSLFAAIYPAAFIAFLLKIDRFPSLIFGPDTRYLLVFILVVIWIFDTASYFAGRAFGKHPFFPGISPKKTIEGFIGGVVAAMAAGIVAGFFFNRSLLVHFFFLSILIGLSGQAGDLSESIIKRDTGIKDSSHIIPGHGGVLDRFDSLLFAGPAVYGYLVICQVSIVRCPW